MQVKKLGYILFVGVIATTVSDTHLDVYKRQSKMNLVLEFPAADAANFSVGQTAQVTLDGTFEVLPRCV